MAQSESGVNPEELRLAMRHWATGVTVVSAHHGSVQHGMTVSSFTSVSLSPPLVLVSLEKGARTHALVQQSGAFAVCVLRSDQQWISDRFAGRLTDDDDRYAGLETFTLQSKAPLLAGCMAGFDCQLVASYEAGTHTVFIGRVVATYMGEETSPLLYFNRDYHTLNQLGT